MAARRRRARERARWKGDPGPPYAAVSTNTMAICCAGVGGAVLGEVLEDLPERAEAALEVGRAGVRDAQEAVLADGVLKELGDVGGELADRLFVVAPGGDGKARRARGLAGCDQACGVEVLRFISTVDRAALQVVDRGVQLVVGRPAK